MRVSGINIGVQNNFLNAARVNQTFDKDASVSRVGVGNKNRDTANISPKGKVMSMIESLTKQKQKVFESKNNLVSSTLAKGGSLDDIKSQLESYEEQLKVIDEQILQARVEEARPKEDKEIKKIDSKEPKTEDEIQMERVLNITNMSTKVDALSSIKTRLDGNIKVLESEIELDKSYGIYSARSKEIINNKENKLTKMKIQSSNIMSELGEKMTNINDKIEESTTAKPVDSDSKIDEGEDGSKNTTKEEA